MYSEFYCILYLNAALFVLIKNDNHYTSHNTENHYRQMPWLTSQKSTSVWINFVLTYDSKTDSQKDKQYLKYGQAT